jgi:hypothetical protein
MWATGWSSWIILADSSVHVVWVLELRNYFFLRNKDSSLGIPLKFMRSSLVRATLHLMTYRSVKGVHQRRYFVLPVTSNDVTLAVTRGYYREHDCSFCDLSHLASWSDKLLLVCPFSTALNIPCRLTDSVSLVSLIYSIILVMFKAFFFPECS